MDKWKLRLYRGLLRACPRPGWQGMNRGAPWSSSGELQGDRGREIARILERHRAVGACVATFDRTGVRGALWGGVCGRQGKVWIPVTEDTVFRTASVTKHITAMGVLQLSRAGRLSLDADVNTMLPYLLRHPDAENGAITLRRLMSHTAGLQDGQAYQGALTDRRPASVLLEQDSFRPLPVGFQYSNFGAGLVGCVLEGALKLPLESVFQQELFGPLHIRATFVPQRVQGVLSSSYRVLPPWGRPAYDGAARQRAPEAPPEADPEHHYIQTQGNLCISAPELARLGSALLDGAYDPLREEIASFGKRDHTLSMGLGTFILRDPSLCSLPLYGHQGLAYGAVHGLWYSPRLGRGVVLLTSGCSVAREEVVADINKDLIRKVFAYGDD